MPKTQSTLEARCKSKSRTTLSLLCLIFTRRTMNFSEDQRKLESAIQLLKIKRRHSNLIFSLDSCQRMSLRSRLDKSFPKQVKLRQLSWRTMWTKLTEKATWTTRTDTFCLKMCKQLRNVLKCSMNQESSEWTTNQSRLTFGNQKSIWLPKERRRIMQVCSNWSVLSWKKAVKITLTKEIIANSKPEDTTTKWEGPREVTSVTEECTIREAIEAVEEVATSTTTGVRVSILQTKILRRDKTTWVNSHNMAITNQ